MNSHIDENIPYIERIEEENKLKEKKEFLDFYDSLLENEELKEKLEKIKEAKYIWKDTVWDTNEGILECAIRNGFLESEFKDWLIIVYNVG